MENGSAGASVILNIPFGSHREAHIAKCSLQVDPEPSRSNTKKYFSTSGSNLKIEIISPDIRELRISINSVMDHLYLVSQTIQRFGPPIPVSKKVCLDQEIES